MKMAGSVGSQRKRQTGKKALKIEEEFERAVVKTKRTLRQVQRALDRLHAEVSGQRMRSLRIDIRHMGLVTDGDSTKKNMDRYLYIGQFYGAFTMSRL
jgi:hypothetical protein